MDESEHFKKQHKKSSKSFFLKKKINKKKRKRRTHHLRPDKTKERKIKKQKASVTR